MTFRSAAESIRRPFPSWPQARRSFAFDVTLAIVVGPLVPAIALALHLRESGVDVADAWLTYAAQVIAGLVLIVRRRHPEVCVAIVAPTLLQDQSFGALLAAYAVAAYVSDRRRMWLLIGVLCLATWQPWDWRDLGTNTGNTFGTLTPACYGLYIASRRRLIAALGERAERAEREQELRAEQAREEERDRLAGDMHDIVTHRVSLMVLQAGAMRSRAVDDATRRAAEDLRSTGCQALAELRDLVSVLRTAQERDARAPVEPAVLDASALVEESAAAGVDVRLEVEGTARPASPVVVRTAYRVVQESLTNVHKHAPGAFVRVLVRHTDGELRITVTNTAPTRPPEIELGAGGTGLVGLHRRIELTGGTFRAGPRSDGGFELDARLSVGAGTASVVSGAPGDPNEPSRSATSTEAAPGEPPSAVVGVLRARPVRPARERSGRDRSKAGHPTPEHAERSGRSDHHDRSDPTPTSTPGVLTGSRPETG
ncbi:sensor histidine kinase [Embleya hyalina]|uniref:sensor histidine kinase n=1 Tax=Embleya hyalina TaxID=516124 RepID=UPI00248261FA|nr:histidine kinase [Embleya hyalina]